MRVFSIMSRASAVAQHLHQFTAQPEDHDRAKLGIGGAAQDQFVARHLDHRLHGDAMEGAVGCEGGFNVRECSAYLGVIFQVEADTATVGFVSDGF
jgi:hypothetical protein